MTVRPFRVALSASFRKPDGSMTYPSFDLSPLTDASGIETRFLSHGDPIRAAELEDIDALILLSERFTKDSIPASGILSVVARFGVGYDTVDVEACTQNDIAVCITPDGVRRPVAVSILTLMLALTGKLVIKHKLTRRGPDGFAARSEHMGLGLVGRTLGSVGIGNIGAEMFRLAAPLGMKFIAYDPFADLSLASELGVDLVDLDTVFAQSDVISINCPLTPDTHHLVNASRLSQMKPTAYLINTARGPIVNQADLTQALQNGSIAGAGLDVFEVEPPAADDPILKLDNVILTPHALCWTDQCFAGIGAADITSVLDIRAGRLPVGLLNQEVTERSEFFKKLARLSAKSY
jgi:phosphoglycerate dehydrogenase-like enzyme